MKSIHRIIKNGVAIERLSLTRATINEAQEIKDNLLDDIDCDKIIVDLSACNYVDSTFFGAMVFAYRVLRHQGCSVVLVIGQRFLSRSFIYEELTSVFRVSYSIDEALTILNNNRRNAAVDADRFLTEKEPVKIAQTQLIAPQESQVIGKNDLSNPIITS